MTHTFAAIFFIALSILYIFLRRAIKKTTIVRIESAHSCEIIVVDTN
jgi:hypothetical protein